MFQDSQSDSEKNRDDPPPRHDAVARHEQRLASGRRCQRLATLFLVLAGLCPVACAIVSIVLVAMNRGFEAYLISCGLLGAGGLLAVPGIRFLIRGRKYRALSANEALANDPRPPVIYLRSFKDDKAAALALGLARASNLKYLWHWALMFYNAPHEFAGLNEEETLAQVLRTAGPMVAIGRPGEKLPQLGAARVYVDDAVWRQKVQEFLQQAALVVLRLGKTDGFWWEVEQSAKTLDPRRLVFLVPLDRNQYEEFRQRAGKYFLKGLPTYNSSPFRRIFGKRVDGRIRGMIYFKSDWTPVFVNLYTVRWPWKYIFAMMSRHYLANIYDWALQPVFEQIGAAWNPPGLKPKMAAYKSLGCVVGNALSLCLAFMLPFVPYILVSRPQPASPAGLNQLVETVQRYSTAFRGRLAPSKASRSPRPAPALRPR